MFPAAHLIIIRSDFEAPRRRFNEFNLDAPSPSIEVTDGVTTFFQWESFSILLFAAVAAAADDEDVAAMSRLASSFRRNWVSRLLLLSYRRFHFGALWYGKSYFANRIRTHWKWKRQGIRESWNSLTVLGGGRFSYEDCRRDWEKYPIPGVVRSSQFILWIWLFCFESRQVVVCNLTRNHPIEYIWG